MVTAWITPLSGKKIHSFCLLLRLCPTHMESGLYIFPVSNCSRRSLHAARMDSWLEATSTGIIQRKDAVLWGRHSLTVSKAKTNKTKGMYPCKSNLLWQCAEGGCILTNSTFTDSLQDRDLSTSTQQSRRVCRKGIQRYQRNTLLEFAERVKKG